MKGLWVFLWGALLFAPVGAGCGGPALLPDAPGTSTLAGVARINVQGVDGDTITFAVFSDSLDPVTFDRDALYAVDPKGDRRKRIPDGGPSKITVAPDTMQEVRVRFAVDDLRPETSLQVVFTDAISVNGKRLPMPSIRMRVPAE